MTRVLIALMLTGCWDGERASLPLSVVAFEPEATAPEGWSVTEQEVDVACPDGRDARIYFVHPTEPAGPMPVAIVYHPGAFDYIDAPPSGRPLEGESHQEVLRLEAPWAIRMVYATLGMYPEPLEEASHSGALPAALAEAGVAMVFPVNCWGDLWHNKPGVRENDFFGDQFFRAGGTAAEWPWRMLTEPGFSGLVGIEVPFEAQPGEVSLIGLGEGGRAVGEVLAYGATPRRIVVEGHNDDLDAWSTDQPGVPTGLARIFLPSESPMASAFSSAATLPPTLWIYSTDDDALAPGSQDLALARLTGAQHTIVQRDDSAHLLINVDVDLAAQAATFVTSTP